MERDFGRPWQTMDKDSPEQLALRHELEHGWSRGHRTNRKGHRLLLGHMLPHTQGQDPADVADLHPGPLLPPAPLPRLPAANRALPCVCHTCHCLSLSGGGPISPSSAAQQSKQLVGRGGNMERGPVVGAGLGAGARIRALLGCLVKVLLWVASALLYFGSEQAARLLGSPCLRRLYHAWLAAVVIFGPLLQFHVNPRTIFASHGNFFNM